MARIARSVIQTRSEEHTSELQSRLHLVCRLLLEKKKKDAAYNFTQHTFSLPKFMQPGRARRSTETNTMRETLYGPALDSHLPPEAPSAHHCARDSADASPVGICLALLQSSRYASLYSDTTDTKYLRPR